MARRPPSLELRIRSGRSDRARSVKLARGARAVRAVAALALLAVLLTVAAAAPSALAALQARRQYQVDLARREQLGGRLRALVERLEDLDEQGRALAQRVERYEAVYGLPSPPEREPVPARGAARAAPDTIFAGTIVLGRKLAAQLGARLDRLDRQITDLADWERRHAEEASTLPLGAPLGGDVPVVPASGFGIRRSAPGQGLEFHAGLDFAAPAGAPVHAAAAGMVTWSGEAPTDAGAEWWRLGRIVVVRHGQRYLTVYGHCDELRVPRGRRVRGGEALATVGSAGWLASPRLHYEIRRLDEDGIWRALDPRLILLAGEPAAGAPAPSLRAVEAPVPERLLR